jgi:hypothetical protein
MVTATVAMSLLIGTAGCAGSDSSSDTTADSTAPSATTPPGPTTPTVPVTADQTIAGSITYSGDLGSGVIIVVASLVGSNGPPAYSAVLNAAGPYALTGVADGEYIVQAFLDEGNDRGAPENDEAQGFYDPNGDGTPDAVVIAGGVGLLAIDITLV